MKTIIEDTFNRARELYESGDEAGALALIRERFIAFPEELQSKILAAGFIDAITKEAAVAEERAKIVGQGVDALKTLAEIREALEEESEERKG